MAAAVPVRGRNIGLMCRSRSNTSCDPVKGTSNSFLVAQYEALTAYAASGAVAWLDGSPVTVHWFAVEYVRETDPSFNSSVDYAMHLVSYWSLGHIVGTPQAQSIIEAIGAQNPYINFTIIDALSKSLSTTIQNRTETVVFREDQAGYLAGVLAAAHSRTGHIAALLGPRQVALKNFGNGFVQGALKACPGCHINVAYFGSFSSSQGEKAAAVARQFVEEGADVIFGCGGGAGSRAIRAVAGLYPPAPAPQPVYVIGVDHDEYLTTFGNGSAPNAMYVLGSAIKRSGLVAVESVKNAMEDGRPHEGTRVVSLQTGGVGIAPCHEACEQMTNKAQSLVRAIFSDLERGLLDTGVDPTNGNLVWVFSSSPTTAGTGTTALASSNRSTTGPYAFRSLFNQAELRYSTSATVIPVVAGEALFFLCGDQWSTLHYIDISNRFMMTASTRGNSPGGSTGAGELSPPPPDRLTNFSATVMNVPFGNAFAVILGGLIRPNTTTGSDRPHSEHPLLRLYVLGFNTCSGTNLCHYNPYWLNFSLPTADEGGPLPCSGHSVVGLGHKLFLFGGKSAAGGLLADLWEIELSFADSAFTGIANVTKLPSPPTESLLSGGVAYHSSFLWTSYEGFAHRPKDTYLVVVGGMLANSSGKLHDAGAKHLLSFFSLSIYSWITGLQQVQFGGSDVSAASAAFPVFHPLILSTMATVAATESESGSGSGTGRAYGFLVVGDGQAYSYSPVLNRLTVLPATATVPSFPSGQGSTFFADTLTPVTNDAAVLHTARMNFHFFAGAKTRSSNVLQLSVRPAITCAESLHLVTSPNETKCEFCRGSSEGATTFIVHGECLDCSTSGEGKGHSQCPVSGTTITVVVFVVVLLLVFVIGIVLGVGMRYFTNKNDPHRMRNAPRQLPCALGIVSIPDTAHRWRMAPGEMGRAIKLFQKELASLIARHQCYFVRHIGDAYFIVAEEGPQMLRLLIDICRRMRECHWPSAICQLESAAAMHWASPTLIPGEDSVDYCGVEVDVVAAIAFRAKAGEILVTPHASGTLNELDAYVEQGTIIRDEEECYNDLSQMLSLNFQRLLLPDSDTGAGAATRTVEVDGKKKGTTQDSSTSPSASASGGLSSILKRRRSSQKNEEKLTTVVPTGGSDVGTGGGPELSRCDSASAGAKQMSLASRASTHSLVTDGVMTPAECTAAMQFLCETVGAILAPLHPKERRALRKSTLKHLSSGSKVKRHHGRSTPVAAAGSSILSFPGSQGTVPQQQQQHQGSETDPNHTFAALGLGMDVTSNEGSARSATAVAVLRSPIDRSNSSAASPPGGRGASPEGFQNKFSQDDVDESTILAALLERMDIVELKLVAEKATGTAKQKKD